MPLLPRVRMACWFWTGGTGTAPAGSGDNGPDGGVVAGGAGATGRAGAGAAPALGRRV
jgi:hypothetical protein